MWLEGSCLFEMQFDKTQLLGWWGYFVHDHCETTNSAMILLRYYFFFLVNEKSKYLFPDRFGIRH